MRKQREQNDRSHSVALLPWCRMNSGWMLSIPAALFGFRCLIADFISSLMNSPERLVSTLGALRRSFTSPMVFLVNSLSVLKNLPLLISCAAMESAVMGHGFGFVVWPVSLLMVYHAHQLEWVKSIDSTVLIHLSLYLVLGSVMSSVAALALSALVLALLWACRSSSHSSSQQGT